MLKGKILFSARRWGVLYFFRMVADLLSFSRTKTAFRRAWFLAAQAAIAGVGEGTPQQVSRRGKMSEYANFGTVVETCSKKLTLSSAAHFAAIYKGRGGCFLKHSDCGSSSCPLWFCFLPRTETENAKRIFSFSSLLRQARPVWAAACQKWAKKTPRISKNLWHCRLVGIQF